jgi:hypothetical protein
VGPAPRHYPLTGVADDIGCKNGGWSPFDAPVVHSLWAHGPGLPFEAFPRGTNEQR